MIMYLKMNKMKKSIYLSALAALALTACSNNSDEIFDQSAAERLEQYKKEYADVLTADGGLWTMEYFSNPDEPGYLFVMKFDKNGSVEISANHKWIGGEFKQEISLWKMIADNGPVLSFNSYNNLFHIFSDPANITGPDAPKGDEGGDINETGYGHEGDYEFQVMEVSDEGKTVRLLGKKRMYDIYLRRLDPSTDVKQYMEEYKILSSSLFVREIPNLLFTDENGERFIVSGCETGVLSIYPESGDPVDQTRSGNFILTPSGLRFMKPLLYVNASGEENEISEFKFVKNHSLALVDSENSILSAGVFSDILMLNKVNWKIDLKALEGVFQDGIDKFNQQLATLYGYKSAKVNDMSFDYDEGKNSYVLRLYVRVSSKGYETYRFLITFSDKQDGVNIKIGDAYEQNSQLALNAYTELQSLFSVINSTDFQYNTANDCGPNSIELISSGGSFTIKAL